jgi:2-keto-4-pentenoate hydratase
MPLSHDHITQAASELIAIRNSGQAGPRLPATCRPADLEDGWQVQQEVTRGLGLPVGGWKAGLPGPGKWVAAPIYAPTLSREAVCVAPWPDPHQVSVEPELAFVLAHDLPARAQAYTEPEVNAAIASVHAALEICASRYADPTQVPFPELLADGLVNGGLWMGPALHPHDASAAAAFELRWQLEGAPPQTIQARHPDGNPRAPLYWLANFLRERGPGLRAGQVVITGSYAGLLRLPLERRATFDYADLARFDVTFRRPHAATPPA